MAIESSAEQPVAVRTVSQAIAEWIGRLGAIWVEGQVTQLNRRPGNKLTFMTLRDTAAEVSLTVTCTARVCTEVGPALVDGARIVVHAKPTFYAGRGTLSLMATEIRPVGQGALLARIEALKALLAAEGLFAAERKRPLPFLPRRIGLICGRDSAAQRDVIDNARRRWPGAQFAVEPVAVQGPYAVAEVVRAIQKLDRDPEVQVIVVTRGGGSVEDLLPFSDEALVRAASEALTPLVSAIGHEQDLPILDLVADLRASTPTDAARRIVPDITEEQARVRQARDRLERTIRVRIEQQRALLTGLTSRPVLTEPATLLRGRAEEITRAQARGHRTFAHRLVRAHDELTHLRARVRALSPAATLDRGYAVLQTADGAVVREPDQAVVGASLRVRVAGGEFTAGRLG